MPLISVCILVESIPELLTKSVQSVCVQTFSDWEILLAVRPDIDFAIPIEWKQNERIKVITVGSSRPNALNDLLKASKGQYIQFLQVGDVLVSHCLQTFAQAFALAPEVVLVAGRHSLCTQDGIVIEECLNEFGSEENQFVSGRDLARKALTDLKPSFEQTSSICFRKEFARHQFDADYFLLSQFEFFLRLLTHGDCLFLSERLCKTDKFERQTDNQSVKLSMVWLADVVRLRDSYKKFLTSEQLEYVYDDFYAAKWAGQELVYVHLSQQIAKYPGPLKLTSADVCNAAKQLDQWSTEHLLDSYAKLTFELMHSLRVLNWWKHHSTTEAQKRIDEAYERGRRDAEAKLTSIVSTLRQRSTLKTTVKSAFRKFRARLR
ncbi:MAG: hypothetical protein P4L53_27270 [Candidatus Obscuribacterales bacterium]|nr:hypothetical protein [Candidatus Obscuribacterales bacterium]